MRFKKGGHATTPGSRYEALSYNLEYDPHKIPQTEALKRFRLNLDDLRPLKVVRTANPVDPHYAPMKLYRVADLQVRSDPGEGPVRAATAIAARARSSCRERR